VRNALTVDVEEWFHICGVGGALAFDNWSRLPSRVVRNTHDVLTLLHACRVRATFFVVGWVADRYPSLVADIVSAGHEIGSHGHLHRRVYELSRGAFAADVRQSIDALTAAGAPFVRAFRAPEWSINERSLWALDELARAGVAVDSSMAPLSLVGDPRYPQTPYRRPTAAGDLVEFPPLVERRFGQNMPLGTGWGLRMSDPARVVRVIAERNRRGVPVALVVHPWELDPDPPRVRLPLAKRFAHYFRLDGFRQRLERIVRSVPCAPMGEALSDVTLST
jgi:polysaccharide deacetylase family protein (PEP-CTERM system associated)